MATLQLLMNSNLYLRDPQDTELGRKIVRESIMMIDDLGFEEFTFKKLAHKIQSTEASIYRYFENKHRLLIYLIAWYWNWLEYRIDYSTHNIEDPYRRLDLALRLVTEKKELDDRFSDVDEASLFRLVIKESDKTYLTRHVDEENKEGLFRGYKSLCKKIADIVQEINPDFPFPHSLISTALQASHQQIFYAQHLPTLSDFDAGIDDIYDKNFHFLRLLILKATSN